MSRTSGATIVADSDLPRISSIAAGDRFQVDVTWESGARSRVDLAPDILTFKIYMPLRDNRQLFERVSVCDDGNAICWNDGAIDMPATAVERLAEEQMSAESMRAFMHAAELTRDGLAAQLGVSRRLVGYWLEGRTIPRYIMLACRALAS